MISALIEPQDLQSIVSKVKILDATYGVPDAPASFARAHIGDAQFFDIDAVADPSAPYPHTLPTPEDFSAAVSALGISNDDDIVVYDQNGISFAAARVWWMFRVMGHNKVRVLNGGLPAWMAADLPVKTGPAKTPAPGRFMADFKPALYRSFEQVENNTGDQLIDARNTLRFEATVHTPDGDAVPAHMDGAANVPFDTLLDTQGRMKPADDIAPMLLPLISPGSPIVTTCGSGVTACVLALGFHEAGYQDAAVYDGSWTEWSHRNGLR